jgi:hypothetical protein
MPDPLAGLTLAFKVLAEHAGILPAAGPGGGVSRHALRKRLSKWLKENE